MKKKELADIRACCDAIEATNIPARIYRNLQEIINAARRLQRLVRKELSEV